MTDLTPLRGLRHLRALDLTGTAVTDLAPLARLPALRSLNLGGSRVTDPTPLAGLVKLTELVAYGTPIRDLAPLGALRALASLDLRETPVVDVRPLLGLRRLTYVNLDQTALPYADGEALEAALRRRHATVDLRRPRRPLVHFPGALDADAYRYLAKRFARDEILKGGTLWIGEVCVARPGDWNYRISRMDFDPEARRWTLWLDVYGSDVELELWSPRDVRVGIDEFTVGGADRITYVGKRYPADRRTAFRLA